MFPSPKELLRSREGTLAETPLPLLLRSVMVEERTCTLELKVRQLHKRIAFEDGVPIACESNLLHELLGKYLVSKGRLTEEQYQQALAESVQSGRQFGELVVHKQWIAPFDLYKHLQANLAHKILEAFRWVEARYQIVAETEPPKSAIKMNSQQLIWTGTANFLPFETVATHLVFVDEQRFATVPTRLQELAELKVSSRDAKFLQLLRESPTFQELQAQSGYDIEATMRRLFALCVLGYVDTIEVVAQMPAPVEVPAPKPVEPPPVTVAGLPFLDEDVPARDALMTAFLEHRRKDVFELLGVPEDVASVQLRKTFLDRCARFSPERFKTAELREKAEVLLAAHARAYGQLCEAESLALHKKRRQASKERQAAPRSTAAEHFRIRTDLLDATTQFDEGKRRLAQGQFRQAVEYFEFACDIEPRAIHRAHLALARFRLNPNSHGKLALHELSEAVRSEPECELAWAFTGDVAMAIGEFGKAEEAYRRAFKLNPAQRRYPEAIKELSRLQK